MREIKFRAWDTLRQIMRYDLAVKSDGSGIFLEPDVTPNTERISGMWRDDSVHLMQFTGLKDKNGKEIYEGDIINVTVKGRIPSLRFHSITTLSSVEFRRGCFVMIDQSGREYGTFNDLDDGCEAKVIGNIHGNPEKLVAEK